MARGQSTNPRYGLPQFEAEKYAMLITEPFDKETLKKYLSKVSKDISKNGITCMNLDIDTSFTIGAAPEMMSF